MNHHRSDALLRCVIPPDVPRSSAIARLAKSLGCIGSYWLDKRMNDKTEGSLCTRQHHNRIKSLFGKCNSPIRHEKAMPASRPCSSQPKKSVSASLLQCNGWSSWNSIKCDTVEFSINNDELIMFRILLIYIFHVDIYDTGELISRSINLSTKTNTSRRLIKARLWRISRDYFPIGILMLWQGNLDTVWREREVRA